MVDYTGRPAYLEIADDLRGQIAKNELTPGDRLPSIAELAATHSTSTTTVRQALSTLRNEGLVVGRQGKGTFVRPSRTRHVHLADHLYVRRATVSPFAAATRESGASPSWDYRSSRDRAAAPLARRLGIREEDPVMRTDYRFFADGVPIMLSTSHEPLELTAGTDIEFPEEGPVTGVVPRFDSIGIEITHVVESVSALSPRPFEAEALRIPAGVPVMVIERTYYSRTRAVETADMVVAGDNYTLRYSILIPPPGVTEDQSAG